MPNNPNEDPFTENILEEALNSERNQYNKDLQKASPKLETETRKINTKNIDNLDINKSPTLEIRYLLQKYKEERDEYFTSIFRDSGRGGQIERNNYASKRNKIINRINDILDSDPNISSEFIPTLPQQTLPEPINTSRYQRMKTMVSKGIRRFTALTSKTQSGGSYTKKNKRKSKKRKTNKRKSNKRYSSLKL
jgi:hypothetical protein